MLRWLLITVYLMLCLALVVAGADAYRVPNAGLDAGAIAFFCAFWFGFAALGFYLKQVWFVTIASVTIGGLSMLYLLVALVDLQSRSGGPAPIPWAPISGVLGLFGFLLVGEVYAIVLARRKASRQEPDSITPRLRR